MIEEILFFLRDSNAASSIELARDFLKFKNPEPALAHRAITGILGKDRRFSFGSDNLWHAVAIAADQRGGQELRAMSWRAVHVLTGNHDASRKIFHVSIWEPLPLPKEIRGDWLEPPTLLTYDERTALVSGEQPAFDDETKLQGLFAIATQCNENTAVFVSFHQFALLRRSAGLLGIALPEEALLLSHLFSAAHVTLPKPVSLSGCYRALFERDAVLTNAQSYGAALARCVVELIERLAACGITTMADLDSELSKEAASFDFSGKSFSFDDLQTLPQRPGVYAFTLKTGDYLYIGKTSNLRRRITGYFRQTDESPEKLQRLRAESHTLTTHECGSELESLIYEYRLIRKYIPVLNSKIDINERKGAFKPINDCIILLPHAQEDKGMSFWFRRNQKIMLKPFAIDFQDSEALLGELETFFFSDKLPAQPTDFPEQEIAQRWIKAHQEELIIVPVFGMKDAKEILEAIKNSWGDVEHS